VSNTKVRFVSQNKHKLQEAETILSTAGVTVAPLSIKIEELQTEDTERLVRDKTLRAFQKVGRPLFVEHTGLYLNHLDGLPGGLTQVFWDTLKADRFAELYGNTADPGAIATTVIGYTDAKQFYQFEGKIEGRIAAAPAGARDFQWDCVFVPDGQDQSFAEMGDKKNELSMRRLALDSFASFLKKAGSS
jgi:XTP/dITP diphosphohydrolase